MSELETLTREQLVESVEFWRTCYHRRGEQIMELEDQLGAAERQIDTIEARVWSLEARVSAQNRRTSMESPSWWSRRPKLLRMENR